ncbi:unnamed protein product, partial [Ixodes hexagonus]
ETLVCSPFPAEAVKDLDYDRLSGDWREIRKTQGPLSALLRGRWRLNFAENKFDYHAAFIGNQSCAPPIKGEATRVFPNSQYELRYNFFGQPVKETLTVVATDYDTYAIVHRCAETVDSLAASGPCPPHAVHVTLLARHPLDDSTAPDIRGALRRTCVSEDTLASFEDTGDDCQIGQERDPNTSEAARPAGTENCFHPLDTGFCQAKLSSFYYSETTGKCEPFTYTGCGGNSNNFQSLKECLDKCQAPLEAVAAVTATPEVWFSNCSNKASCALSCPPCCFWNESTTCIVCQCELLDLGPRLRPANCISSPSDCPAQCQSNAKSGGCYECSCLAPNGTLVPALEYVPPEKPFFCLPMCTEKTMANGERKCHCAHHDICSMPLDEGSCDKNVPRYFFNTTSSRCDVFQYKGCTGNENNFESHEDCLAECEDLCHMPKDPGACATDEARENFYYNSQTGRCEAFEFTGCGGNDNRFEQIESCRTRYGALSCNVADVCHQPKDSGPCYAYLRRFYYNSETERCEPFIYGGCMGNGNNFYNMNQCNRHCRNSETKAAEPPVDRALCHLPLDEGSCDGTEHQPETRFYYDAQKEDCVSFVYAGCGGNDNNFRLLENCNLTCFGVQTLILKAEASCTGTECHCGKFRMDGGCKVCECGNGSGEPGAYINRLFHLLIHLGSRE